MRTLGAIRIFVTTLLAGCAGATPRFAPDAPISVQLGSSRWKCAEAITALAASRDGALLAAGGFVDRETA